jgi:hypothetical protein
MVQSIVTHSSIQVGLPPFKVRLHRSGRSSDNHDCSPIVFARSQGILVDDAIMFGHLWSLFLSLTGSICIFISRRISLKGAMSLPSKGSNVFMTALRIQGLLAKTQLLLGGVLEWEVGTGSGTHSHRTRRMWKP